MYKPHGIIGMPYKWGEFRNKKKPEAIDDKEVKKLRERFDLKKRSK